MLRGNNVLRTVFEPPLHYDENCRASRELLYSLNNDKPYEEHATTGFPSPTDLYVFNSNITSRQS